MSQKHPPHVQKSSNSNSSRAKNPFHH